ncbi:MAG: hypothetical protein WBR18_05770 [Anaerolineales bacterium]
MYILIDHDECKHAGPYRDRCLSNTMRHVLGHERYCMAACDDDGRDEITVVLREDGQELTRTFQTEDELASVWLEGSLAFEAA